MSFNILDKALDFYNSFTGKDDESSRVAKASTNTVKGSSTPSTKNYQNCVVPGGAKAEDIGDKVVYSDLASKKTTATNVKSAQNKDENNGSINVTQEMVNEKEQAVKRLIQAQSPYVKKAIAKHFDYNAFNAYQSRTLEERYEFLTAIEEMFIELNEAKNNATIDERKLTESYIENNRKIFDTSEAIEATISLEDAHGRKRTGRKREMCSLGSARRETIKKVNAEKTQEAKIDNITSQKNDVIAEIEQKRAFALEKCKSNPERCKRINQYFDELIDYKLTQMQMYGTVCANDNNGKLAAQFFRKGAHQAEAEALTIYLEKTQEGKAALADMHTHAFHNNKLKLFNEQGDPITSDVYGNMVAGMMQYKTAEAAAQYEQEAYEYRLKVEKGEIEAPWLTKDHLTAESVAIGVGIHNNANLSGEQKAELLTRWDSHAKQFADYELVKQKYAENIASAQSKTTSQTPVTKSDGARTTVKPLESMPQAKPETLAVIKPTLQQLTVALTENSIDEVKKQYPDISDREITEAVLHDAKLKRHWPQVINYINTLSEEDLAVLINGCTTDTYCFVLRNISPAKATKLYDLSSGEMCYAARTLGENILEEADVAA